MASINYNEIFSRFYMRVQAYDLVAMSDEQSHASQVIWLHMAASKPYIRQLFTVWEMDDELESISYTFVNTVDDSADKEFILEIMSIGMVMQWLEPKIDTLVNIAQTYTDKNTSYYSQASHLSTLQNQYKSLDQMQRSMIVDRGYIYNSYVRGGES